MKLRSRRSMGKKEATTPVVFDDILIHLGHWTSGFGQNSTRICPMLTTSILNLFQTKKWGEQWDFTISAHRCQPGGVLALKERCNTGWKIAGISVHLRSLESYRSDASPYRSGLWARALGASPFPMDPYSSRPDCFPLKDFGRG